MRERLARLSLRLGPPIGVGLVLGLIGPFGTFDLLPTAPRLAYWLAVVSVNWLLADAVLRRLDAVAGERMPMPRPHGAACGRLSRRCARDRGGGAGERALGDRLARQCRGPVRAGLAAARRDLAAGLHMGGHAGADRGHARSRTVPEGAASGASPSQVEARQPGGDGLSLFAARLSAPLEGRLLCLEMQDHYLKVHHSADRR
jgi:hypothetical protein